MRILGIDFGTKTIGLSVSDETGLIAHGIGIIKRKDRLHDLGELQKKIDDYKIERIIVGLPKNMDGSLGKSANQVLEFVENLKNSFSVSIDTWDERLSTIEAERVLLTANMSRQKRKKVVDKMAATIILQGYLDHMNKNRSS